MSARPYLVHTFELSGDTGDITIAVECAGDPVELSIGSASWALPPGLCIAFGKMLAAAGHASIDGKRRQAERAARLLTPNEDRGLRIEGDVGAVTNQVRPLLPCAWELLPSTSSGKCELCGESWQAGSSRPYVCRAAPETAGDDDAAAFRQHRLDRAASETEPG